MIKGLLKGLCIAGLTLLPISFSSAVNYVELPGSYEDLGGNNCTINSDLSFDCSNTNNVIVGTDSAWLKSSSSYFRTNSGLAMYIHFQNGNDFQGYITSFAICGSRDFPNCNSQMSYQDFLTYASNYELTNWEWYASQSSPGFAGPVFIFGDTYIYYVPHTTSNGQLVGQYGSYTPYDFGLNGWGLDANYTSATNSPFYDISIPLPDYSVEEPVCNQNWQALMGFEYMGLSKEYCYGGYGINDIWNSGESFVDWTGYDFGGGASIFDYYNIYSGGLSIKPFLSTYYQYYNNAQVSNFYGKSKGLFYFYQQFYSLSYRNSYDTNLGDLLDYCTLLFNLIDDNYSSETECYTGGNDKAINYYISNRNNNDGVFQFSGFITTTTGGVSSADEFFGRLTNLFNNNLNGIEGGHEPVIPSYIVLFMLAIILIRLISH